jgi:hypothetical protein
MTPARKADAMTDEVIVTNVVVLDPDEWPRNPCGHLTRHGELAYHLNNYVRGAGVISECAECDATWDDV